MVVLDGHVFRVASDGVVHEVPDDATTPFAVVTRFGDPPAVVLDADRRLRRAHRRHRRAARLRQRVLRGARRRRTSTRCTCRAACRTAPGVPLAVATEQQAEFELGAVARHDGRLLVAAVRFGGGDRRLPPALPDRRPHRRWSRARLPRARSLQVRLQEESDVHLALPDTAAFRAADLTRDPTADLDRSRSTDVIHHRHVDTNGIRMHVAEAGPDDGPRSCCATASPSAGTRGATSCRRSATPATTCSHPTSAATAPPTCRPASTSTPSSTWSATSSGCSTRSGSTPRSSSATTGADRSRGTARCCAPTASVPSPRSASTSAGIAPVPTPRVPPTEAMRAALGDAFLYFLYFQEPGVAEARARRRPPPHPRFDPLRACRATCPRDEYRFFDPTARLLLRRRATTFRGRSPWLSTPTSTCSSSRSRTTARSPAASTGIATSTATRSCSPRSPGEQIEQPALFIGAELDSIFGQTEEAVLATRARGAEPARSGVDRGLGTLDPAGGARRGQRGVAGVPALVAGLGRSSILIASAVGRDRTADRLDQRDRLLDQLDVGGFASGSKCSSRPTWR